MDLSNAFDKVCHGRLIHKLGHCGIRGRTQIWIVCHGLSLPMNRVCKRSVNNMSSSEEC